MVLTAWLKSLLQLCFIIYLGGIVPLVHLTSLSPHQELPRYRLAIFDSTPRPFPPDILAALAGHPRPALNTAITYEHMLPLSISWLCRQFTQGYLLASSQIYLLHLIPLLSLVIVALMAQLVYLPPPDKPPMGFQGC